MRRFVRLATHLLVLTLLLSGQAFAQNVLTPGHVARLRLVGQAAISPTGTDVAYVLAVPRVPFQEDDGPSWTELHVVGADGQSRPFVTGAVNVAALRWTSDGRHIAFLARRGTDTTRALYVVPRDGGEARKLFAHTTDIVAYEFSPDGRQLAFIARDPASSDRATLARSDLLTGTLRRRPALSTRLGRPNPERHRRRSQSDQCPGTCVDHLLERFELPSGGAVCADTAGG